MKPKYIPFVILALVLIVLFVKNTNPKSQPPTSNPEPTPITQKQPTTSPDMSDQIKITSPTIDQVISSPLTITGQALGKWFFEGQFMVYVFDGNKKRLADTQTNAKGDWMSPEFIPFTATIKFDKPATPNGFLVFERNNPSNLPQNNAQFVMPIKFQ